MALGGRRWREVRNEAVERDGNRCLQCGADGRYVPLEVDHITPISAGGKPFDMENLQTLCFGCHMRKTLQENNVDPERVRWIEFIRE